MTSLAATVVKHVPLAMGQVLTGFKGMLQRLSGAGKERLQ